MTNRFKDFGNGNAVDAKPLSFKLHEEEFHCVPSLQGKILLNLVVDSNYTAVLNNRQSIGGGKSVAFGSMPNDGGFLLLSEEECKDVVYSVPCGDCGVRYIGETGQHFCER
jgi:hypothetical protein